MKSWALRLSVLAVFLACAEGAELQIAGVPNFHPVNEHIYRGGQPSPQGFHNLAKLGVRTIVDLRNGAEREVESGAVQKEGMRYFHVPMPGAGAPTEQQVSSVLHVLDDSTSWPVFLHCRRGADRTGTIAACYRIAHDGWDNQKALDEARIYGMSWTERAMQHYILTFTAHLALIADPATPVSQDKAVQ